MLNAGGMSGPIVMGGVGGSGTRVVAEILKGLGFYLGSDLNEANDNLWFTLLFKRPAWYARNYGTNPAAMQLGAGVFEKAMAGGASYSSRELAFIGKAALDVFVKGHDHLEAGRGLWALKRMRSLLSRSRQEGFVLGDTLWGWKEPNSHIYIDVLAQHFPGMKYIHVMRHGLDMAFSRNQAQLYNWGFLFDTEVRPGCPEPRASLQYWIAANRRALSLGRSLLGDRLHVVNFERLCASPEREISALLDFLGFDARSVDLKRFHALPKRPSSTGRYRQASEEIFAPEELASVEELGFEVL